MLTLNLLLFFFEQAATLSALGEATKTTKARKNTHARGRPRRNVNDVDDCNAANNRRQRQLGGNDKAVKASRRQ